MKTYSQNHQVKENETAKVVGSGSLEVYATPAMIALMENTATKTITDLEEGQTTVGTYIMVDHLKASKVGENLICTANLIAQDKRKYEFEIEVYNENHEIVGKAKHIRFAVDIERFMK